ncbi:MAG: glycosyltransferase [Verrucomicrobiota bacterium]
MQISIITANYPSVAHPNCGTFVEQLVKAWIRNNVRCSVIYPYKFHELIEDRLAGKQDQDKSADLYQIRRPGYMSAGSRNIGALDTFHLTQYFFEQATRRAFNSLDSRPEAVYGHFLYYGGAAAVRIGRENNLPSFVAVGESSLWALKHRGVAGVIKEFRDVCGIVAVSSPLKRQLVSELGIPDSKIRVFPNGVDLDRFYPRDRRTMRKKFGLPETEFLVAFVGHFDHRKGVSRVCSALEGVKGIGLLLVGGGSCRPDGHFIRFKGIISHDQVPEMLSAADIFVLPTLGEGSCNAILEALACGLPVITSQGDFNDDIVTDQCALRVDPEDVLAIRRAILLLKQDSLLRQTMTNAALAKAKMHNINQRSVSILNWMESMKAMTRRVT